MSPTHHYSWFTAFVLTATSVSCVDQFEPDVGPLLQESCFNEDSDLATDVSFSMDIMPRLIDGDGIACSKCHTTTGATPFGVEESGFDVSTYAKVRVGGANGGSDIVIPGQPCQSVMYQKMSAAPPFGGRMPLRSSPANGADLQLLKDWIVEGARDN